MTADRRVGKFPLMLMGGQAEGLACADLGARTLCITNSPICLLSRGLIKREISEKVTKQGKRISTKMLNQRQNAKKVNDVAAKESVPRVSYGGPVF